MVAIGLWLGVSGGAGAAVQHRPARERVWPSFDCGRVRSGAERLVCASEPLSIADRRLAQVYRRKLAEFEDGTVERAQYRDAQEDWLSERRDACSTAACLFQAYRDRTQELGAQ
jgi:uncharacterized protein